MRLIAQEHGGGHDVDLIAGAYREQVGAERRDVSGQRLENIFKGFCPACVRQRGRAV